MIDVCESGEIDKDIKDKYYNISSFYKDNIYWEYEFQLVDKGGRNLCKSNEFQF